MNGENHAEVADVVVVGAGFAGLAAANELARAGRDVLVVEAAERAGGRTAGHQFDDLGLDAGGAYTGPRHTSVRALAARCGARLVRVHADGDGLYDLRGQVCRTAGGAPLRAVAIGDLLERLEEMSASVPLDRPGQCPEGSALDAVTVAAWQREALRDEDARLMLTLLVQEILAADPEQVSLLHLLFYVRSGGGAGYLTAFDGGAQQDRFDIGAFQVAQRLAAALPRGPRYGSVVHAVTAGGGGVTVEHSGGHIRARHAVLAVPPVTVRRMRIRGGEVPHFPSGHRSAALKIHIRYDEPFWHGKGLSGWVVADHGPVRFVVDDSAGRGSAGVLVCFVVGSDVARYRRVRPPARRAAILAQLVDWLGPDAAHPVAYHERDWVAESSTVECFAAVPAPGEWTRGRPVTEPAGQHGLYWAGTERSANYYGHLEGAVRSGHRAAADILSARPPTQATQDAAAHRERQHVRDRDCPPPEETGHRHPDQIHRLA